MRDKAGRTEWEAGKDECNSIRWDNMQDRMELSFLLRARKSWFRRRLKLRVECTSGDRQQRKWNKRVGGGS